MIGRSWSDNDEVVAGTSVISEGVDGQALQATLQVSLVRFFGQFIVDKIQAHHDLIRIE